MGCAHLQTAKATKATLAAVLVTEVGLPNGSQAQQLCLHIYSHARLCPFQPALLGCAFSGQRPDSVPQPSTRTASHVIPERDRQKLLEWQLHRACQCMTPPSFTFLCMHHHGRIHHNFDIMRVLALKTYEVLLAFSCFHNPDAAVICSFPCPLPWHYSTCTASSHLGESLC